MTDLGLDIGGKKHQTRKYPQLHEVHILVWKTMCQLSDK